VRPADETPAAEPPPLRPLELARWAWRQLTSMRVALFLLFLLAVVAIPGSIVPQREANPLAASDWAQRNPGLVPWAERLGLFDVYSTPWFSAVYLLLMISLVGCIAPRLRQHARALRATPPAAPRRLDRMPAHRSWTTTASTEAVLDVAEAALRERRFRVQRGPDVRAAAGSGVGEALAAERGYLKETGNLVFHISLVLVLVAVAVGSMFGYRGTVLVVEGSGFANSPIQYDGLSAGSAFDVGDLPPFALTVDSFEMSFVPAGPAMGTPDEFVAEVTLEPSPGAPTQQREIRVNTPLAVDGTLVHLLNPGYAPAVTVRDGAGEVVFTGPVPFLPQDASFTSTGVVKVPQADTPDLGLQGIFLPTGVIGPNGPESLYPGLANPVLVLNAWQGDLGLDDGVVQSVYRLDTDAMTQLSEDGEPFRAALEPGQTAQLPDGAGSVTFDGVTTWVNLQVSRNAGKELALAGALLAVLGLLPTLFVRRRRVWVRVRLADATAAAARSDAAEQPGGQPPGPRVTVVEVAGLDRVESGEDLAAELTDLQAAIEKGIG
jgi:cytochrome c biogenesis protein